MTTSTLLSLLPPHFPPPTLLPSLKRASVALILRATSGPPDLLFIQRSARPTDPWSAHIAFPGGHRELSDTCDLQTAIRETREELGLDLSNSANYKLIARLPDRRIGRSEKADYGAMCAFVFLQVGNEEDIKPNVAEVAKVFWVSMRYLHGKARVRHLMERGDLGWGWRWLGLQSVKMAAVDVLSVAKDVVEVGEKVPKAFLWGLSLECVGDFVERLGGRRVDWPVGIPGNRLVEGVLEISGEVFWWVWGLRMEKVGLVFGEGDEGGVQVG